jgi:cell division protease FtsH
MNNNRRFSSFISSILFIMIILSFFARLSLFSNTEDINTNKAIEMIDKGDVKRIDVKDEKLTITSKDDKLYQTFVAKESQDSFYKDYIKDKVEDDKLDYNYMPAENMTFISSVIQLILTVVMIFLFFRLFISRNGMNSEMSNFSKNKAVMNKPEDSKIKFSDVAGLKEEKEELYEIVDFLKNPARFAKLGARIPKGVLMVGPPGTGKTYISKAVAGEANVPFFSISGSDFVEMFVGVGASRVRSMFQEAKKNAPCIIFIDEIDAVGRQRGTGLGGGHDEREQTLNQLLVEMDGFSTNEGIIMIAATNRPDILDKALLRPGRFDRTVHIGIPDARERVEILKVHTRKKPIADDIDLEKIAKAAVGFTPADIENLTNEAALLAARDHRDIISNKDFQDAEFKILAGPEKKSKLVIEKERRLTAFHEAGHAITQTMLKGTDPVDLITIVPRANAGGFTSFRPKEERSFVTKNEMINQIISLLGGRAAEEIILDDISTGASNDIERATKIAKAMVTTYGMSDKIGPVNFSEDSSMPFVGRDIQHSKQASEETLNEIDEEIRTIIESSYQKALQILRENIDLLKELADLLLEKETIREKEFEELAEKYKEGMNEH